MGSTPSSTVCPGLAYHQSHRAMQSRLLFGSAWEDDVQQLDVRPTFRDTPLSHVTADPAHTHGEAAAARSSAVDTLTHIALQTGRTPYFVSMSRSDQRRGELGNRYVYMSKDLVIPFQDDKLPDDGLAVMIDVDYYVDMNWFLTTNDVTVALYTLSPRAVAGRDMDAHFRFKDNVMEYIVAGGATYHHELWDYGNDHFNVGGWRIVLRWLPFLDLRTVVRRAWNVFTRITNVGVAYDDPGKWFGYVIPIVYPTFVHKTYYCERRAVTEHRSLVLLQQQVRLRGWGALYAHYFGVNRVPITRLRPKVVCNGRAFNRLQVVTNSKIYYSVGADGSFGSCELEADRVDSLISAMNVNKKTITRSTVESYFPSSSADSRQQSVVLLEFLIHLTNHPTPPRVFVTEPFHSYQFGNLQSYDEEAKVPMHAFMSPILGPVPVAEICKANEEYTVKERIDKVKHTKPLRTSKNTRQYMREYVDFVVGPYRHQLVPVDYEEVFKRQNRPQQRAILERGDANVSENPDPTIQAFQKAQVENKIGPPRNISTVAAKDKLGYAQYSYAVSDHIKERPDLKFMSSAHTPREISEHIAEMCSVSTEVALSDYSKMDGRVSNLGRELWRLLTIAFFSRKYHETLIHWISRDSFRVCYTKHGVKYMQDYTMASGSMVTSLHNTNENAFTAYMAYRYLGMDAQHAFRAVQRCRFQGDDSFMPSMCLKKFISAAKTMGHVVEGRMAYRSRRDYIDYLSRYFGPEVWFGDPSSVSDMKRRMWGLHATHLPVPTKEQKIQKLKEKAMSFALTDPRTPFLGLWSQTVLEQLRVSEEEIKEATLDGWWARFPRAEQWYQLGDGVEPSDWMIHLFETQLPGYNLKAAIDYLTIDVRDAEDPIAKLLNIPCFLEGTQLELVAPPGVVLTSNTTVLTPGKENVEEKTNKREKKENRKTKRTAKPRARKPRDTKQTIQERESEMKGAANPPKKKGDAGKKTSRPARAWARKPGS